MPVKSILMSKTFWACIVGAAAEVATAMGYTVLGDPAFQAEVVGWLTAGFAALFRHMAVSTTTLTLNK